MVSSSSPVRKDTTILIVEDSPTQLEHLRYLLEAEGYRVVAAANGMEAYMAARVNEIDLVISDIVMPEMDGYTLCKTLRWDPEFRDLPVILLTSLTDPQDVVRGLECGANNFICKPYQENALLARVKNLLTNHELRRDSGSELGIQIYFSGQLFRITADRLQILDLLLSTYETAVSNNSELARVRDELRTLNEGLEARIAERTATLTAEIAERKQAEASLRTSENRLSVVVQNSQIGVWELTLADNSIYRTIEHDRIFGYEAPLPKWTMDMFLDHVLPEDRAYVTGAFLQAAETKTELNLECRIRRADGKVRWIAAKGAYQHGREGHSQQILGTVQDITKRKESDEVLRNQLEELRRWYLATLGGETRITNLKQEVNDLLVQAGQPPRYPSLTPEDTAGLSEPGGKPDGMPP